MRIVLTALSSIIKEKTFLFFTSLSCKHALIHSVNILINSLQEKNMTSVHMETAQYRTFINVLPYNST